jgi:hypothetical protein
MRCVSVTTQNADARLRFWLLPTASRTTWSAAATAVEMDRARRIHPSSEIDLDIDVAVNGARLTAGGQNVNLCSLLANAGPLRMANSMSHLHGAVGSPCRMSESAPTGLTLSAPTSAAKSPCNFGCSPMRSPPIVRRVMTDAIGKPLSGSTGDLARWYRAPPCLPVPFAGNAEFASATTVGTRTVPTDPGGATARWWATLGSGVGAPPRTADADPRAP